MIVRGSNNARAREPVLQDALLLLYTLYTPMVIRTPGAVRTQPTWPTCWHSDSRVAPSPRKRAADFQLPWRIGRVSCLNTAVLCVLVQWSK